MNNKKEVRPRGRTQRETSRFIAMQIVPESENRRELARAVETVLVLFLGYFAANLVDAGVFF